MQYVQDVAQLTTATCTQDEGLGVSQVLFVTAPLLLKLTPIICSSCRGCPAKPSASTDSTWALTSWSTLSLARISSS
jgi:hypothetical protein